MRVKPSPRCSVRRIGRPLGCLGRVFIFLPQAPVSTGRTEAAPLRHGSDTVRGGAASNPPLLGRPRGGTADKVRPGGETSGDMAARARLPLWSVAARGI